MSAETSHGSLEFDLNQKAASGALEEGFSGIAASLYRDIIDSNYFSRISNLEKEDIKIGLITALIAEGDFKIADKLLSETRFSDINYPRILLRKALLSYIDNDKKSLNTSANELKSYIPHKNEIAWHNFIMSATLPPGQKRKKMFFDALESSSNESQRAELQLLRIRSELLNMGGNEILLANIKAQMEVFKETDAGKEFCIQYILVLNSLGRIDESLEEIQNSLNLVERTKSKWRDRLLLFYALIAINKEDKKLYALESLIQEGQDLEYMHMGLKILTSMASSNRNALILIDKLLQNDKHILHEYLLSSRIRISIIHNKFEDAESFSKTLITDYPNSKLKKEAYWILAASASKKNQKNYRLIANYLLNIQALTKNKADRILITLNVADCYFLDNDFDNAIYYYNKVNQEDISQIADNAYIQIINSYLKSNRTDDAINYVDNINTRYDSKNIYYKAYWNIIMYLIKDNHYAKANDKINSFIKSKNIKFDYKIKYLWLQSLIFYSQKRYIDSITLINDVLNLLTSSNKLVLHNNQNITSILMLDKARAHLKNNEPEIAFTLIKNIQGLPNSKVVIEKSKLVKANYFGSNNRLDEALKILINITENFVSKQNYLIALFEASIYLERLGQEQHLIQCISILQKIIDEFPSSNTEFYARIRLINIYRNLNEFNLAIELCNKILYSDVFQNHEQLYKIYLIKNESMHALAKNNHIKLQQVFENYTDMRLKFSQIHELNLEIIYKQSIILRQLEKFEKLKELLYKEVVHKFIQNNNAFKLNNNSQHWISRSLLLLSNIYEIDGQFSKSKNIHSKIIFYKLPGYKTLQKQLNINDR